MKTQDNQAGFTLVETLVALVVLSFLVIGLAQGLRFGLRAWNLQTEAINRDSALDTTDRTLRRLLEGMEPGDDPQQPAIQGSAHSLAFIAELPAGAPLIPLRRADIGIGVLAGHGLVLRWLADLHGQWLTPPEPQTTVLLPEADGITFSYWRPPGHGPAGWVQAWKSAEPPALIRIHLSLTPHGRHWPDIIVAPMRSPLPG